MEGLGDQVEGGEGVRRLSRPVSGKIPKRESELDVTSSPIVSGMHAFFGAPQGLEPYNNANHLREIQPRRRK